MKKQTQGFLIIEVLLAIVILTMVFLSLFSMVSFLTNRTERSKYDGQAAGLIQEGLEVGRSTLLSHWNFSPQNYFPIYDADSNSWTLTPGSEGLLQGRFTRTLSVQNVCRSQSDGTQMSCPAGQIDPKSKLLMVTITWQEGAAQKQAQAKLLLFNKSL